MSEDQIARELRQIYERLDRFKTEGEIKSIVDDRMRERTEETNRLMREQATFLSKIADGAQSQMYSAAILHGNPATGLKGFVPDVLERLTKLEVDTGADRALDIERDGQITLIKAGQGRILNFLHGFGRSLFINEQGQVDWKKIATWVSGSSVLTHVTLWPRQSWSYAQWVWSLVTHRR